MRVAVYLPLLLTLLAAPGARLLAARCEPRLATWLLTLSALVLAAAGTFSLGLLALTGLLRVPPLAALGQWSLRLAARRDPVELSVAVAAGLLLALATVAAVRLFTLRCRTLTRAAMDAACLAATDDLVIVEDPVPDAYALPGLPGRVVVSTGMLDTLDPGERAILLAHERTHLAGHHYAFVALAQLGAAANPLLRPLATAVAYTVERWADERAAAVTGDRRRVAHAVGKAALAAGRGRGRPENAALGIRGAGPVPRRVAALLGPPAAMRAIPALATAAVLGTAIWSLSDAVHDLHVLLRFVGV
ncbi:M56 family metallopeptidase [Actinoallomurus iriomotensis]|uniref:Membrane protein n=1 Tax=Actinoallomurus iriomotensis TaxID=478107 RepID=A0A9W6RPB3_9ACTN|nr:M56 family metallopeptidase [Actinoallomurus iriomotensis]GLY79139.1 membrane protein [Actinoallomurus iriomotensis]